jgi:hypothetical protein
MDNAVKVQLRAFPTSASDEREWSASHSGRFIPGASARSSGWTGVTLIGNLDEAEKRNDSVLLVMIPLVPPVDIHWSFKHKYAVTSQK